MTFYKEATSSWKKNSTQEYLQDVYILHKALILYCWSSIWNYNTKKPPLFVKNVSMHCGEEKVAKIIIIRTCRMLYKSRQVDLIFPPKITGNCTVLSSKSYILYNYEYIHYIKLLQHSTDYNYGIISAINLIKYRYAALI